MHSRATDRRSASKCQRKWPDQTLEQAFGLPEVLVAVSTSRLSCKRGGTTRTFDAGLGFIWRISSEGRGRFKMKLARREFLHLAAGATRPAGPAGPPGGGGGGGRPFGQNVLDYGANPTGQSDSVGAFEAAMKAGGATTTRPRSYGLVQIPLGRYAFSRPCNLAVVGSQLGVRFQG